MAPLAVSVIVAPHANLLFPGSSSTVGDRGQSTLCSITANHEEEQGESGSFTGHISRQTFTPPDHNFGPGSSSSAGNSASLSEVLDQIRKSVPESENSGQMRVLKPIQIS